MSSSDYGYGLGTSELRPPGTPGWRCLERTQSLGSIKVLCVGRKVVPRGDSRWDREMYHVYSTRDLTRDMADRIRINVIYICS